jgi:UDP-N-acetylglucosamine 2-epimerase (non-hydrolysing)
MGEVRILSIVGARPNYMKMAPVLRELSKQPAFESLLVHTGQHYDNAMSEVFFQDLGIPKPTFNLNVGSASHAVQTAEIMRRRQFYPGLFLDRRKTSHPRRPYRVRIAQF